MKSRRFIVAALAGILTTAVSFPASRQLFSMKAPGLNLVYYSQGHAYIVSHLARCFESTMSFYTKFFDYKPSEEVSLFLQDFSDWGNGGATAIPRNLVYLEMSPFLHAYDVMPANERMNWMMNHELVHVATMDKAFGSAPFFRTIFFGKVDAIKDNPMSMLYAYLTVPRAYAPRWYIEGIAVFMETWMNGGLGRGLGSYDEMVFRTKILENSPLFDALGLESEGTAIDWQTGTVSYMYGTRFFSYLAQKFGPEKLIEWTATAKNSRSYFASQFKAVYGIGVDEEWSKWITAEKEWQAANLDRIRKYPVTPFRALTSDQVGSVSRAFLDAKRSKIYAAVNYPGHISHIAALDLKTGRMDRLCDIKGWMLYYVSSLAFDAAAGKLFYTTDNNSYRSLNVVDVTTGKSDKLITDLRTGDLAFNPVDKSLWGVRHNSGISTIVRIPPPYTDWTAVHAFDYFTEVYDLDISPDGSFLTAAMADVSGQQKLVRMNLAGLLGGNDSYDVLYDFGTDSPADFVFSPDGKFLYGSSYYSGVSNVFRYSFAAKTMDALSNAETGFFRPVPVSNDEIMVFRYSTDGFIPGLIPNRTIKDVNAVKFLGQEVVNKYPIVKSWRPGSPASVNIDAMTTYTGGYNSWSNMKLDSAYPILEGYKDSVSIGVRMNLQNALRYNGFDLTASYTPSTALETKERLHLALNYHFWEWKFRASLNGADFYDLFGPTKVSRKGYAAGVEYTKNLISDDPRTLDFDAGVDAYWGLDRLPDAQNIDATYDKLVSARAGLKYDFVEHSLGAVDEEKGVHFALTASANYVNAQAYPRFYASFDYGLPLPIGHSSLWLRTAAGQSLGSRDNVFVNFYFGGFGNNWIDYQDIKRYRKYYSFPGAEIDGIGGRNFGKVLLEWTLPPIRFRRLGFVSFYCNWARLALFTSGIITNFDVPNDPACRKVTNVGAQLDFRMVIFSTLNSTFSLGYARAFEPNAKPRNEFMISLKLL